MDENNQPQDQTSDDIREAMSDRESKMEQHLGALRQELTDVLPSMRELIKKHPIGSATTVLGIGLVVGYWISGRKRSPGSRSTLNYLASSAMDVAEDHLAMRESYSPNPEHVNFSRKSNPRKPYAMSPAIHAYREDDDTSLPPSNRREGVLSRLVNLLVPMGIEMGLKALEKNESSDDA